MANPYVAVLVFGVAAVVVAAGLVAIAALFGQRQPTSDKLTAYECGIRPTGDARLRFPAKFYLVAIMFLLFSLEVIFFIPWAVIYRHLVEQSRWFGLAEMGVFVLILAVGYVYVWGRGGFDWQQAE